MSVEALLTVLIAGVVGHATASLLIPRRLAVSPERLMRTNVSGRRVPAVLGEPLIGGVLAALGGLTVASAVGWEGSPPGESTLAAIVVTVVMWAAGAWDDRRGDESSRGFSGHLQALRSGRLTGGVLKIAAGAFAGGLAGYLLFPGDPSAVGATLMLVALNANAINLFDRAPGRGRSRCWRGPR